MDKPRFDWTFEELKAIYEMPLLPLVARAHTVLAAYHPRNEIQICALISIKTGGCPEDCKYCSQSSRYKTATTAQPLMSYAEVIAMAREAVERGATRVCLGAAWREVRSSRQFEDVLEMVRGIAALGAEVCCCLGMLKQEHADALKEAGLYAYNHNLDTSRAYYPSIITSRTYDDRLNTLDIVQKAGITVCCGGIIGLGESAEDRISLIHTLATRTPHPDSVPINTLCAIPGTPLSDQPPISIWEVVRTIATARIAMPHAMVRLSAGRSEMSYEQQALCFLAGAHSIWWGEKLLTVSNSPVDRDEEMFRLFGLKKRIR